VARSLYRYANKTPYIMMSLVLMELARYREASRVVPMANTSSYATEMKRLVASVWMREKPHTGKPTAKVMTVFRKFFTEFLP
jgi:hypothetical protein